MSGWNTEASKRAVYSAGTFLKLADGHHAVVAGGFPDAQGFVVTHSGTHREQGVRSKPPHLTFHVTLHKHIQVYCAEQINKQAGCTNTLQS